MGIWMALHKFIAELMRIEEVFDEENPDPDLDTSTSRV
jgi:hypothetical protein